jgi:hypothetical protein
LRLLKDGWKVFERLGILGPGQRRGAHVNVPKIGSRDGVYCIGGILGVYAVLRRELCWGNLNLAFFEVLVGFPREGIEEGGQLVLLFVLLRELIVSVGTVL